MLHPFIRSLAGSQFFLTTVPCDWLNGVSVVIRPSSDEFCFSASHSYAIPPFFSIFSSLSALAPLPRIPPSQKHVVFGQVVAGYEVVKAIEAVGSRSGQTAFDVMVADSGELPKGTKIDTTTKAALGGARSVGAVSAATAAPRVAAVAPRPAFLGAPMGARTFTAAARLVARAPRAYGKVAACAARAFL